MFDHVQRNLAELAPEDRITIQTLPEHGRLELLRAMVKIAHANHLDLCSCFSDDYVHVAGVQPGSCVDIQVLRKLTTNPHLDIPPAAQLGQALRGGRSSLLPISMLRTLAAQVIRVTKGRQRHGPCRCMASIDIGNNDTCLFGCTYCLATPARQQALLNYQAHDPDDSLLFRPINLRCKNLDELAIPFTFESDLTLASE